MPHKRSKRSVREADRASKGYNLAPSGNDRDDTPRNALRIFNAAKVQAAFRARGGRTSEDTGEYSGPKGPKGKKRVRSDDSGGGGGGGDDQPKVKKAAKTDKKAIPKIMPNESLGEYNRRVEALLRPGVSAAIKSAASARGQQLRDAEEAKARRRAEAEGKPLPAALAKKDREAAATAEAEATVLKPNRPAREFAEAPLRRRVGDVAEAPPSLPKMRLAAKAEAKGKLHANGKNPLSAGQARIMEEERLRIVSLYRDIKAKKEAEREAERAKAKGAKKAKD